MKSIWKYEIELGGKITEHSIPKYAEFLSIQNQNNKIVLWYFVDTLEEMEIKNFKYVLTGHEFTSNFKKYLGTVQLNDGTFVVHVFEEYK